MVSIFNILIKIDHHCPWLSICIGGLNHKQFLYFIAYSIVYVGVIFSMQTYVLFKYISLKKVDNVMFYICAFLVLICFIIFLFLVILMIFQIKYIINNITTSEALRKNSNYFSENSYRENCFKFNNEIFYYKFKTEYNNGALLLMKNNKMLVEYLFSLKNSDTENQSQCSKFEILNDSSHSSS